MPAGLNVLLPRLFFLSLPPHPLLILSLSEFKLKDGGGGLDVAWGKEEGGKREERC